MSRLDPQVQKALDETGMAYRIEIGGRHLKIIVAEKFCGILPLGKVKTRQNGREMKNIVAQIRRAARSE